MTTDPNSSHLLSVLIFSPLAAAAVAAFLRSERLLRGWTLAFTSALALFSLQLWAKFDITTAAAASGLKISTLSR